jgi:hypothetical protein
LAGDSTGARTWTVMFCSIAGVGVANDGGRSAPTQSSPTRHGKARYERIRPAISQTARDQVIPSITAVMAAARTAIVAVSTVTAAANHRSSRSRRARATPMLGKAEGIAGRVSTRIIG